jgi:hypothetical protein
MLLCVVLCAGSFGAKALFATPYAARYARACLQLLLLLLLGEGEGTSLLGLGVQGGLLLEFVALGLEQRNHLLLSNMLIHY